MNKLMYALITAVGVMVLAIQALPATAQERDFAVQVISSIRSGGETVITDWPYPNIPLKCGTPFTQVIRDMKDEIDPTLYKFLADRPARQTYIDSEHFRFHYDTTGTNAVPLTDSILASGVPDYIDSTMLIFERVWAYELDTLGYADILTDGEPVPDGTDGGNSLYDIYLTDVGLYNIYGMTTSEGDAGARQVPSYIDIDNDFTDDIFIQYGYEGRPLDAMKVTAAHEFFHSLHFSLDKFEASGGRYWWQEATSTWMEDKVFDEVNDYIFMLPYYFNYPYISLESYDTGTDLIRMMHPYASCIWAKFLDEHYSQDVILDIWDICGRNEGYNVLDATDEVLSGASYSSSFRDAWLEFLIWNYYTGTGNRPDTTNKYSEGNLWADTLRPVEYYDFGWEITDSLLEYSFPSSSPSPEPLGANYLIFNKDMLFFEDGGMRFTFAGDDISEPANSWQAEILGWDTSQELVVPVDISQTDNEGEGLFRGWLRYDRIIFIPSVFGYTYTEQSLGYSVSAAYDTLLTDDAPAFYDIASTASAPAGDCLELALIAHDSNGDTLTYRTLPGISTIDTIVTVNDSTLIYCEFEDSVTIDTVIIISNGDTASIYFNWENSDIADSLKIITVDDSTATLKYCPDYFLIDSTLALDIYVEDPESHYDIKHVDIAIKFFSAENAEVVSLVGYPNPFYYNSHDYLTFRYTLPDSISGDEVQLYVFNVAGDQVFCREYNGEELTPGEISFQWDVRNINGHELASGIYIAKIRVGDKSADSKIAIIR